ncbi:hypothetical protein CIW83_09780 [Tissierella sp. P1]|uniref:hypothetical protein n=1 Tax=Tissierella sp. P1 TaxID=1280483 RepID=UPI000BA0ED80|nr:hypothetical protein [Tissierella sp. P1]OZV12375.1 hypothetical protein CIW83_09780 [Tissierella sp. P1]
MKLSKKAQRLLDYLAEYEEKNNGEMPTLGEIVKNCITTVKTLLSKTWPELENFAKFCVGDKK